MESGRERRLVSSRRPKNFLHLLSFSKFVDELVQVAGFLDQRVFDFLDAITTDDTFNQMGVRIEGACLEEGVEGDLVADERLQTLLIVAGQS